MDTDLIYPELATIQQVSKEIRTKKHRKRPEQQETAPQCEILLRHSREATCTKYQDQNGQQESKDT
jgi:hypothetical protein